MKYKIYQVDAFSDRLFGGNPAAVVPLTEWLEDDIMQKIAIENNLSETAFYVPADEGFHIRWFTPGYEVDLCGHATLATAHVLWQHEGRADDTPLTFQSRSGVLSVKPLGAQRYCMDFPADQLTQGGPIDLISQALGEKPVALFKGRDDYLAVFQDQEQIEKIRPDFREVSQLDSRGLIITARGNTVDFVSRGFFPQAGIDEDPATGSAHTSLVPYWSAVLKKNEFRALQLSKRVGHFECRMKGARVEIIGNAVTYLIGEILI